jgi:hypothetical protein
MGINPKISPNRLHVPYTPPYRRYHTTHLRRERKQRTINNHRRFGQALDERPPTPESSAPPSPQTPYSPTLNAGADPSAPPSPQTPHSNTFKLTQKLGLNPQQHRRGHSPSATPQPASTSAAYTPPKGMDNSGTIAPQPKRNSPPPEPPHSSGGAQRS